MLEAEPESTRSQWVPQLTAAGNLLPRTHSPWESSCGWRGRCPSKVPCACLGSHRSDTSGIALLYSQVPPSVISYLYQEYFYLHLRLWNPGLSTFKGPARNSLSSTTNQILSTETFYSFSKTQLNSLLQPVSLMWSYDLSLSASLIPSLILCFSHKSLLSVPLGLQFYYHLSPITYCSTLPGKLSTKSFPGWIFPPFNF